MTLGIQTLVRTLMLSKSPSDIIAQFFVFVNLFAKLVFPILISAGASTPCILLLPHTFSNAFNCHININLQYDMLLSS